MTIGFGDDLESRLVHRMHTGIRYRSREKSLPG
jgi:hypothetical protein